MVTRETSIDWDSWCARVSTELRENKSIHDGILLLSRCVESLPSRFGKFTHDVPQGETHSDTSSRNRQRDIFPLDLSLVDTWTTSRTLDPLLCILFAPEECPHKVLMAHVRLLCRSLNFLACVGWEERSISQTPSPRLCSAQRLVLEHLLQSSVEFLTCGAGPPNLDSIKKELRCLRVDYNGNLICKARELECSKVIAVWPPAGSAATVPITRFLEGELLDDVLDPQRCLKPESEWPPVPKPARVYASDKEWYKIGKAGLALGIFGTCRAEEVFRDAHGNMVLSGAMGVTKTKQTPQGPKDCLRFICILCALNEYLRRLRGDSHTMPYLGRAVLIQLNEGEVLIIDSADIEGAFNVFLLPDAWMRFFCFAKPVSAGIVGGTLPT